MNAASQDLHYHLGVLRERMLHPTDYELAVHYFLEEFAEDRQFVRASDCEDAPHLVTVLATVVSKAMGRRVELAGAFVSCLREHRFFHGNARVDDWIVLFFYFQETNTGIVMLVPGERARMEVARFRLPGGLADPRCN